MPKTYLLADAPQQSGRDLSSGAPLPKHGRTVIVMAGVTNIIPGAMESGMTAAELGTEIVFEDGRFSTDDPEIQAFLDERGGWCGEEQWETAWLDPSEVRRRWMERQQARLETLKQEIAALRAGEQGR